MIRSILWLFLVAVLLAATPIGTLLAMENTAENAMDKKTEDREMPQSAKLFIGYVSKALLAAGYNMPDVALANLKYAQQDMKMLEQDNPGFTGKPVLAGRIDFATPLHANQNRKQLYYALFPLEGAKFAVDIPELDQKSEKNLDISPRDAVVLLLRTQWNMPKIKSDLDEAIAALTDSHSKDAVDIIQKIIGQDISVTEMHPEDSDKLSVVYHHVMLANNLLMAKNFSYCPFALTHARVAMKEYVSVKSVQYDKRAIALKNEMQAEIADFKKHDPIFTEKTREKIEHWIDTLRTMIKSHTQSRGSES